MEILPRSFYARPTVEVAHDLLGKLLVRTYENQKLIGRIIETEAYQYDDPACHAYRGKTSRNASLFGMVGHVYVYFIYGNHYCLNAVARCPQSPAGGVLIRAIEPLEGRESMARLRGIPSERKSIADGPGKLTQALRVTKELDGSDLTHAGSLFIADDDWRPPASSIITTPRIGIKKNRDIHWRFLLKEG